MNRVLIVLVLFFVSIYGSAQKLDDEVSLQLKNRGEVYISIAISEANNYNLKYFDFDKKENGRYYFYANKRAINSINYKINGFKLEPIPSLLEEVAMLEKALDFSSNWDAYPTYDQYDSIMNKFATDYPQLCKIHNLGTLISGRKILAIQLGDSVNVNQNEPKFLYTSTMHGDETVGYIISLRLIEFLLQNYSTNARVQYIMNNVDLWINPLANPDGTYHTGNGSVNGATRYNMNYVDINRNFPDPQDGPHPDSKVYQQETNIFMKFADSVNFTMSANMHSGVEVVNYPWDTWSQLPADNDWWIYVSKNFADTVHLNSPAGYMTKFGTGFTNGFQWYSVNGGRQDYMNYFKHCREFTLELSNTKLLQESKLQAHWNYLYPSLLNYIEEVTYGINGRVTDSITGFAIKAKVEILNHDMDSSMIFTNDSGYYFRPIYAGTYDVKYSAKGYKSKIISNIICANSSTIIKNVELASGYDAINTANIPQISIFPNPFNEIITINVNKRINYIKIIDVLGKTLIIKDVNPDENNIKIDSSELPSGIYFLVISISDQQYINKIIKQ